eukprot:scaffold11078_cov48-Attheya_sp.AAC.6
MAQSLAWWFFGVPILCKPLSGDNNCFTIVLRTKANSFSTSLDYHPRYVAYSTFAINLHGKSYFPLIGWTFHFLNHIKSIQIIRGHGISSKIPQTSAAVAAAAKVNKRMRRPGRCFGP